MKVKNIKQIFLTSYITALCLGFIPQKANALDTVIQYPTGLLRLSCDIVLGETIASWRFTAASLTTVSSYNVTVSLSPSGISRLFSRSIILPPVTQIPIPLRDNTVTSYSLEGTAVLGGSAITSRGITQFIDPLTGSDVSTLCTS